MREERSQVLRCVHMDRGTGPEGASLRCLVRRAGRTGVDRREDAVTAHVQIKEISSVWARGNAAQFSNFSVFSSWRELLTPRGCRILEVLDVCSVTTETQAGWILVFRLPRYARCDRTVPSLFGVVFLEEPSAGAA